MITSYCKEKVIFAFLIYNSLEFLKSTSRFQNNNKKKRKEKKRDLKHFKKFKSIRIIFILICLLISNKILKFDLIENKFKEREREKKI